MANISLDNFLGSETRLDISFPSAQFHINGYKVRAPRERERQRERQRETDTETERDRERSRVGLIEFVRKGFICK